jgi:glycosyltransferase
MGWGWAPSLSTLFVRRLWLNRIGGFKPQLQWAADYDVVLTLFTQPFFQARHLPQPLVRRHAPTNPLRLHQRLLLRPWDELRAIRQSQIGGIGTLVLRCVRRLLGAAF